MQCDKIMNESLTIKQFENNLISPEKYFPFQFCYKLKIAYRLTNFAAKISTVKMCDNMTSKSSLHLVSTVAKLTFEPFQIILLLAN